jgi:hypothetical protein
MTEQIVLPTSVRGYVRELQAQIQVLSERAANLAANLAAADEQNELNLARIDALQDERAKAKEPRDANPDAPEA